MNRKERRTTGKRLIERLQVLKNSSILQEMDLKDIPKDVLDSLIANICENKVLQKRYNLQKRIFSEMAEIEIWLHDANVDLEKKLEAINLPPKETPH